MQTADTQLPASCPVNLMVEGPPAQWSATRLWRRLGARIRAGLKTLELMDQVRSERRALARLGDRDFADMGIDRATAIWESERGLADLPACRLNQALSARGRDRP